MVHSFIERRMREVRGGLAGDQLADPREKQEKEKKKKKKEKIHVLWNSFSVLHIQSLKRYPLS